MAIKFEPSFHVKRSISKGIVPVSVRKQLLMFVKRIVKISYLELANKLDLPTLLIRIWLSIWVMLTPFDCSAINLQCVFLIENLHCNT